MSGQMLMELQKVDQMVEMREQRKADLMAVLTAVKKGYWTVVTMVVMKVLLLDT